MPTVSDLVGAAINKPVAVAARLARRALERLTPGTEAAPPAMPRKSKGWRRHLRRMKARERGTRG